ncbi:MAG: DNA-3-methyladenine glycosylase 2 family protein, partial [Bacteroidota bacterium]
MKGLVAQFGVLQPYEEKDYFLALVRKIVAQQLSTKAAGTIFRRFTELVDNDFRPEVLLKFDQETYRSVGVSRQKFNYIQDLSRHFQAAPEFYEALDHQSDTDVLERLTQVKGIGTWTAKMFLIFNLGRQDVFSHEDVGLQNAITKLYGFEEKPGKKELNAFAERWAPHRSSASRYLWMYID